VIFDVAIAVTLKPVVNDPQGLVVRSGLHHLGFTGVGDVRVGKYIEMTVDAADEAAALVAQRFGVTGSVLAASCDELRRLGL